jgi:hypothetical protein
MSNRTGLESSVKKVFYSKCLATWRKPSFLKEHDHDAFLRTNMEPPSGRDSPLDHFIDLAPRRFNITVTGDKRILHTAT